MTKNENQCRKILAYIIEHGSITPKEAEDNFRCMRLASRINELRGKKYKYQKIVTTMESYVDEEGYTTRYARYSIAE